MVAGATAAEGTEPVLDSSEAFFEPLRFGTIR